MVFAVVTGGGTSGHVVPAIAVIESLIDAGHAPDDIAYVGSVRGVESSVVPATGVRCEFLPVSGLQRSSSPRSLARNLALPVRLLRSTVRARRLLRAWRPQVVVSVGGYASEPASRAAVSAGVPLVCVSYDAVPGLATRRQSRRASACAVAFEGSALPRAVVTGAPVRRAVRAMDVTALRRSVRAARGIPDDTLLVTVVGGSLGSRALNEAVPAVAQALAAAGTDVLVHHVTGQRGDLDALPVAVPGIRIVRVPVETDMPGILAATDILLSRAGASTVAEIAAVGVASVLVPWPGAAENHQEANARWLADASAAVLVPEGPAFGDRVAAEVLSLARDPSRRSGLAAAAHAMGAANRGTALVELIEKAARAR